MLIAAVCCDGCKLQAQGQQPPSSYLCQLVGAAQVRKQGPQKVVQVRLECAHPHGSGYVWQRLPDGGVQVVGMLKAAAAGYGSACVPLATTKCTTPRVIDEAWDAADRPRSGVIVPAAELT